MPQTIDNMIATWNAAGTTFAGIKLNVTDSASASGSLLMDLQVGGSTKFIVRKDGFTNIGSVLIGGSSGVGIGYVANGFITIASGGRIEFGSSGVNNADLFFGRRAAASLRLGAADAAAPVAQTLGVQSVSSGTADTAGANFTIAGSQGTGTGAGGSIVFQVAPAGTAGSAQNALATALTIASDREVQTAAGFRVASYAYFQTNRVAINQNGTGDITASATGEFSFGSSGVSNPDLFIRRDAANTLALRNGANAQVARIYGSYTSASVYKRLALSSSTTAATVAAQTDTGDMDLELTPAGAGNVKFGTHTGTSDTAISGYITIKDSAGNSRKLAVIT